MNYIKKLQAIKKYSEKTQTELAEILGVSFPTFNSWINEKSIPRERAQQKIEALFLEYIGNLDIDESIFIEKKEKLKKFQKQQVNPFKKIMSNKDLYNKFLLETTYNTNSIEGSTFNEPEVGAVLFNDVTIPNKTVKEHQEAKNHQSALGFIMRWIRDENGKITESFIKKIHSLLMNGILHNSGQYRNHKVRIMGAHVATLNPLKIDKYMKNFVKELNRKPKDIISHISKTHAQFEQAHPFSDGNGRVGRLIMIILAFKNNLAPIVVKKEKKIAYYNYLQEAQTKENYIPLTSFIYDGVFSGYEILDKK